MQMRRHFFLAQIAHIFGRTQSLLLPVLTCSIPIHMAEKKSKLAEINTKPTAASVEDFINSVQDEQQRKDSFVLLEMMKKASGEEPKMWGSSLIGFGNKRYKSPRTGREVDWLRIGFSPRKANLSLYISIGIESLAEALNKLGKHKTGVGCLYIKRLEDIDIKVLKGMIEASLKARSKD
jgi:hypothetical protein